VKARRLERGDPLGRQVEIDRRWKRDGRTRRRDGPRQTARPGIGALRAQLEPMLPIYRFYGSLRLGFPTNGSP